MQLTLLRQEELTSEEILTFLRVNDILMQNQDCIPQILLLRHPYILVTSYFNLKNIPSIRWT